jgi:hypothetical protein
MNAGRLLRSLSLFLLWSATSFFGPHVTTAWAKSSLSTGYLYLAEEAVLVPGKSNSMTSRYITQNGLAQSSEIIDNHIARFEERQANPAEVFAILSPLISNDGFAFQKRSESVSGVDGLYPPYQRLFFRFQNRQAPLYGGLVGAAPASIVGLVQRVHTICPAASRPPKSPDAIFFQATLLDRKTADDFRRNRLLCLVTENELVSGLISATALHNPFKLISASISEAASDHLTTQLSDRQPVLDLEYGGVAFQLIRLTSQHYPPLHD